jgi:hypothetical protein
MTEPRYLFVSAFSSLYLLHYSCLFYFTTWYQSIFDLGCCNLLKSLAVAFWWLLGVISLAAIFNILVSVVGSSPSTISSRLLVHRLQHSRLGCWFIAFNNLVSALLKHSEFSRIISVIFACLYVSSWTLYDI